LRHRGTPQLFPEPRSLLSKAAEGNAGEWKNNNLHIPDDLLSAVSEAASADGKTTDEVAADALRRYLAHRKLEELGNYGREQSRWLGYTEADVRRLIAESRRENRATDYSRPASVTCEAEVAAWLKPTVQSLLDLLQLPENWDGYGAVQIREQIAQKSTDSSGRGHGERRAGAERRSSERRRYSS
jgi:hypothetical protein